MSNSDNMDMPENFPDQDEMPEEDIVTGLGEGPIGDISTLARGVLRDEDARMLRGLGASAGAKVNAIEAQAVKDFAKNYDTMTTDELNQEIVTKEKELRSHRERLRLVEIEKLGIEREMIDLRGKMNDEAVKLNSNKQVLKKAEHLIKQILSEKRELERLYWGKKNG